MVRVSLQQFASQWRILVGVQYTTVCVTSGLLEMRIVARFGRFF